MQKTRTASASLFRVLPLPPMFHSLRLTIIEDLQQKKRQSRCWLCPMYISAEIWILYYLQYFFTGWQVRPVQQSASLTHGSLNEKHSMPQAASVLQSRSLQSVRPSQSLSIPSPQSPVSLEGGVPQSVGQLHGLSSWSQVPSPQIDGDLQSTGQLAVVSLLSQVRLPQHHLLLGLPPVTPGQSEGQVLQ